MWKLWRRSFRSHIYKLLDVFPTELKMYLYQLHPVCLWNVTTWEQLKDFSWNLIFGNSTKICWDIQIFCLKLTTITGRIRGFYGSAYEDRLWNVGKLIPVYTVLQPRRQPWTITGTLNKTCCIPAPGHNRGESPPKSSARHPAHSTMWGIPCYDVVNRALF
jgi:hypothetical protein